METKFCTKCKQDKPFNEFNKDKSKKYGLSSRCKKCSNNKFKGNYKNINLNTKKECNTCLEQKTLHNFPKHKQSTDGFNKKCKECINKFNRERAAKRLQTSIEISEFKKCGKCGEIKELDEFSIDGSGKYGRKGSCKECVNEWERDKNVSDIEWYRKRQDKKNTFVREKYNSNEEYRQEQLTRMKKYKTSEEGKKVRREWETNRYKTDPKFRLDSCMKTSIYDALKNNGINKNYRNTFNDILPYSSDDLVLHLESLFLNGMTKDNYGYEWHVDHLIPKSSFSYSSTDDPEFHKCWQLSNLQPMWAKDNLSKGDKPMLNWINENPTVGNKYLENYRFLTNKSEQE